MLAPTLISVIRVNIYSIIPCAQSHPECTKKICLVIFSYALGEPELSFHSAARSLC